MKALICMCFVLILSASSAHAQAGARLNCEVSLAGGFEQWGPHGGGPSKEVGKFDVLLAVADQIQPHTFPLLNSGLFLTTGVIINREDEDKTIGSLTFGLQISRRQVNKLGKVDMRQITHYVITQVSPTNLDNIVLSTLIQRKKNSFFVMLQCKKPIQE